MTTFYKGESIRIKSSQGWSGPRFGKFAPIVRTANIMTIRSDEGKYGCVVAYGSACWAYETHEEAIEAGERYMRLQGWTKDRETAWQAAIDLARVRHESKRLKSRNYAKHYA